MRPAKAYPGSAVLTHLFIGASRLPSRTLQCTHEVMEDSHGSFFIVDDGQKVVVERFSDDEGEVRFQREIRLHVTPAHAVEIAIDSAADRLSAATNDILRDLMTTPIPFSVFRAYLAETGWSERIVEAPNSIHIWDHPDYSARQLNLTAECAEMDDEISWRIAKLAEITGRIELGVRLDLIRRSENPIF